MGSSSLGPRVAAAIWQVRPTKLSSLAEEVLLLLGFSTGTDTWAMRHDDFFVRAMLSLHLDGSVQRCVPGAHAYGR